MNKKILGFMIAGILALTGCSSAASSGGSGAAASASAEETAASEESTSSSPEKNTIVIYFSASGHTENIADMIAKDTNADTFAITPSEPYTEDDLRWSDENSRVNAEHNDETLQDVALESTDVPDWDSYTTVFIGYPIWWGDASWVVKSFVKQVDFTGKTVIPFCTSSSSPIGDSGKNLAELAGSGSWQDGERFSGSASEDDVQSWLSSIGY